MLAASRVRVAGGPSMVAALLFSCADVRSAAAQTEATISANPNPVQPGPNGTNLIWATGDGSNAEVYVSINGGREILFAGASSHGSQDAVWGGGRDRCEF